MSAKRRIHQEKNERIRAALAAKPKGQSAQRGLSPLQIYEILKGKRVATNSTTPVPRPAKPTSDRPPKSVRTPKNVNLALLLDTPSNALTTTLEWNTPSWFRHDKQADVSVVIPLYKSVSVLRDQVASWDLANSGLKVEIVYVDDSCPMGSKKDVVDIWSKRQIELRDPIGRIYYNTHNVGFGASCNIGAWRATGEYVIFLNADTMLTPNWIKPMIRLLKDPQVGIVGNRQLKSGGLWDGTVDSAGSEWNWNSGTFLHIGRNSLNHHQIPSPLRVEEMPSELNEVGEREMVTGCCMALRRSVFLEMGGFDPNYRVGYWEDSDLCMRFREKGYKVMYQPNSTIYHKLSHSGSGTHRYQEHNRNYFFNKWVNSERIDSLVHSKRGRRPEVQNILVQRQSSHGDVLLATAVLPALKKKYPDANILFNTRCPEVLKGNPYITKVYSNETISERHFQVLFNLDMAYEYRPATPLLESYADAVGVPLRECEPYIATEELPGLPEQYVVVHAGKTAWAGRNWIQDHFVDVVRAIQKSLPVICVGRGGDYVLPGSFNLVGKTSVQQLAYVIKGARLFVGIDSLPMHVAQTVSTPSVVFFGCIKPETRIFRENVVPVIAQNLSCLGCHQRKEPCTVSGVCETGTHFCERNVSVEQVLAAVDSQINSLTSISL